MPEERAGLSGPSPETDRQTLGERLRMAREYVGLKQEETPNPAREAAFVDLVHAVANSNDFAYKF